MTALLMLDAAVRATPLILTPPAPGPHARDGRYHQSGPTVIHPYRIVRPCKGIQGKAHVVGRKRIVTGQQVDPERPPVRGIEGEDAVHVRPRMPSTVQWGDAGMAGGGTKDAVAMTCIVHMDDGAGPR